MRDITNGAAKTYSPAIVVRDIMGRWGRDSRSVSLRHQIDDQVISLQTQPTSALVKRVFSHSPYDKLC